MVKTFDPLSGYMHDGLVMAVVVLRASLVQGDKVTSSAQGHEVKEGCKSVALLPGYCSLPEGVLGVNVTGLDGPLAQDSHCG